MRERAAAGFEIMSEKERAVLPCYYGTSKPAICKAAQAEYDATAERVEFLDSRLETLSRDLHKALDEKAEAEAALATADARVGKYKLLALSLANRLDALIDVPMIPEPGAFSVARDEALEAVIDAREILLGEKEKAGPEGPAS